MLVLPFQGAEIFGSEEPMKRADAFIHLVDLGIVGGAAPGKVVGAGLKDNDLGGHPVELAVLHPP